MSSVRLSSLESMMRTIDSKSAFSKMLDKIQETKGEENVRFGAMTIPQVKALIMYLCNSKETVFATIDGSDVCCRGDGYMTIQKYLIAIKYVHNLGMVGSPLSDRGIVESIVNIKDNDEEVSAPILDLCTALPLLYEAVWGTNKPYFTKLRDWAMVLVHINILA